MTFYKRNEKCKKKKTKKIPCEKNWLILLFAKNLFFMVTRVSLLLMQKEKKKKWFSPIDLSEQNIW
jgi:hypothetical protein